ncbi:MAG: DUF4232 domain-containing protein [Acidimicrobiaceae bacterium]|nr:DUF4232 domain-containing protein [Acidimicrobiaceae bacterium]
MSASVLAVALGLFSSGGAQAASVKADAAGGVTAFGNAFDYGAPSTSQLHSPIVGMARTPDAGGYWLASSDGGVYTFGDARFFGSLGGIALDEPIVGIASTPDGGGYWMVASDGGVFTFGDARFFGSTGAIGLDQPVVGMASTGDGKGYWLVASDGGIFTFGDARFHGSTGDIVLNKPVVGMAATPSGQGYWLVASDGGVFSFGDARFFGSTGNLRLVEPVVGMAATSDGRGYWMVAADGGIFTFGDARFFGSTGGSALSAPVVGMAARSDNRGYWFVSSIVAPAGTCQPSQMSLAYDPADSPGGAAGSVGRTYRFTNTSTRPCSLIGYPGLALRDSAGHPMTTTVTRSTANGAPSAVTLAPGASAFFTIVYATQTGFGNLVCPTSASLAVIPPNDRTALVLTGAGGELQVYGGTTQHLECGNITVTPVSSRPPFK